MSFTKTKYDFCSLQFQEKTNNDIFNIIADSKTKTDNSQIQQMKITGDDFRNNIIQTRNSMTPSSLEIENKLLGITRNIPIQYLNMKTAFNVVPFNS